MKNKSDVYTILPKFKAIAKHFLLTVCKTLQMVVAVSIKN